MSQKSYNGTPSVYIIPTPIGNLEDITLRAINTLKELTVLFAEDTRITGKLLQHFDIKCKLISNHEHNEYNNKNKMLKYLKDGIDVGIVTDRGTPIISDPGFELVKTAIENHYNVISLPGATALIPALTVSGITPKPFLFYGFLNSKEGKRKKELEALINDQATIVFYESPHRILKTLENIQEIMGNRKISISREISKRYEEVYRGTIEEVKGCLHEVKGELVVVLEGKMQEEKVDDVDIIEEVNMLLKKGTTKREAIKQVSFQNNISKNEVYQKFHRGD